MIVKPVSRLIQELDAKSFTVLASPGSDGQGVESLQVFAQGLAGAEGEFIVVLGDVSPLGRDPYYKNVASFIDSVAEKPVYVMPGNHDGPDFDEYFGYRNTAVLAEDFTLIMLDNSARSFSDDTLAFLRDTLAIVDSPNITVAFHYPPPNRISGDSMSVQEWHRFEEAVGVWRKRIALLLCGHARTYFEDDIDGLRLIVTGGGGSHIHEIERVAAPPHHALEFSIDAEGGTAVRMRSLESSGDFRREPELAEALDRAFAAECRAHVGHCIEAEDAAGLGLSNLAHFHRAAAESRLQLARSMRRVMKPGETPAVALSGHIEALGLDDEEERQEIVAAAEMARDFLAAQTLRATMRTGEMLAGMYGRVLENLTGGTDISETRYYVCRSCGRIFQRNDSPNYCSQCGAPMVCIREAT